MAEPVEAEGILPPGRWADPIEPAQPLPQAEVVYASPVQGGTPAGDLFSGGGVDPFGHYGDHGVPLASAVLRPVPPAPTPVKKRPRKRKSVGQSGNVTDAIATFVLFVLLPISGLFFLLGVVQFLRLGRLAPPDAPRERHIMRVHAPSLPFVAAELRDGRRSALAQLLAADEQIVEIAA